MGIGKIFDKIKLQHRKNKSKQLRREERGFRQKLFKCLKKLYEIDLEYTKKQTLNELRESKQLAVGHMTENMLLINLPKKLTLKELISTNGTFRLDTKKEKLEEEVSREDISDLYIFLKVFELYLNREIESLNGEISKSNSGYKITKEKAKKIKEAKNKLQKLKLEHKKLLKLIEKIANKFFEFEKNYSNKGIKNNAGNTGSENKSGLKTEDEEDEEPQEPREPRGEEGRGGQQRDALEGDFGAADGD